MFWMKKLVEQPLSSCQDRKVLVYFPLSKLAFYNGGLYSSFAAVAIAGMRSRFLSLCLDVVYFFCVFFFFGLHIL